MNKFYIIGNLTKDPEISETNSGVKICKFSVAVNRSYTNSDGEKKTDFFNCSAWRGLGETIAKYAKRGNKIAVNGSIEMRTYEDGQGVKRNAYDVIVHDVEFLTTRSADNEEQTGETEQGSLPSFDDEHNVPF